ncbi:penicillin-insensitive murein endopeptidase [Thiohalomonas denitrificans]|uniref:penicillin-insensitive murein endopeptidase n=1 Tax=Thiohalomonas denitrificans TaxID=415747 RepID=UPI0026ED6645|nr:penicillin-insensitive murein endopeptidase [Thiohalomonas denitrificans]
MDVATASNRIRPKVIGGGGIPNLSAGSTGVKVEVNDSGCPNRPLPDADITIETRTVAGSGGHTHMGKQAGTGSFPSGNATETGITNEEGVFRTEYTAGVVGLKEQVIATARADVSAASEPPNIMESTGETELTIAIPDLVPLTPSSDYELYQSPTGQDTHRQNNYGTLGLVSILQSVASQWIEDRVAEGTPAAEVKTLSFNDMSLPNGGVFDLCKSLQANCSHVSHEVGIDVDVNVTNRMGLDHDETEALKFLFMKHEPSCRFIHKYHFRCEPALTVYRQ